MIKTGADKEKMSLHERFLVVLFGISRKFESDLVVRTREAHTSQEAANYADNPFPTIVAFHSAGNIEKFDRLAVVVNKRCIAEFGREDVYEAHVAQFGALYILNVDYMQAPISTKGKTTGQQVKHKYNSGVRFFFEFLTM